MKIGRVIGVILALSLGGTTSAQAVMPFVALVVAGGMWSSALLGLALGFFMSKEKYQYNFRQKEAPMRQEINRLKSDNIKYLSQIDALERQFSEKLKKDSPLDK